MKRGGKRPIRNAIQNASWAANQLRGSTGAAVSDDTLTALATVLREVAVRRGQVLYRRNEIPHGVWLLRSATVELRSEAVRKRSIVQLVHPGEVVGDIPVLLDLRSPLTARVVDQGSALFINGKLLHTVLRSDPQLAYLWLQSCATRLHRLRTRVMGFLEGPLVRSLALLLLDESEDGRVGLSQTQIAQMLGVQRTSVNRALRTLKEMGSVEAVYGGVILRDPGALRYLVRGSRSRTTFSETR